jgi:hypothetical protein
MILFRKVYSVDGLVVRYSRMPSLVIEAIFGESRWMDVDSVLLHGPEYFEVLVENEGPPKVRPWSKELFQEMRREAEGRGKSHSGGQSELERFDSMVEWLRMKGIPPPSS